MATEPQTRTKDLVIEVPDRDFRVNRRAFTDEALLEVEREAVFARHWLYLGHTSEVPANGDYRTRRLAGEPFILCRDRHGDVRVFYNSCTHRGAMVCREPQGSDTTFTCFYHAWTFRNSGELIGVTDKKSFPEGFDTSCLGLASPRFEVYRDFVFVNVSGDAGPLLEHLEPVRPYLDAVVDQSLTGEMEVVEGSHLYSMRGNWKLIVENSIDGYHGLPVHQTYFAYLKERGYDLSGGLDGTGLALGRGHAVMEYSAPFARSVARTVPPMDDGLKERIGEIEAAVVAGHGPEKARRITQLSKNILVYPNLLIIDAASLQLRSLDPTAVDYTEVSAWLLAPRGEDRELREIRINGYLEFLGPGGYATPDDAEAVEVCQLGFGRHHGPQWSIVSRGLGKDTMFLTDEEQIRGFWRQWQADVAAAGPTGGPAGNGDGIGDGIGIGIGNGGDGGVDAIGGGEAAR